MRCPDCGTILTEVNLSPTDQAYRCFKCGGFWVDSWAVNRISGPTLSAWRRISAPVEVLRVGGGVCPLDGLPLKRYVGENVPPQLLVKRCDRCGKWWFGGDSLFSYKPAQEAKVKYFQLWGLTSDVNNLLLPVVVVVILALGIWVGLDLIRSQQRELIKAVESVFR